MIIHFIDPPVAITYLPLGCELPLMRFGSGGGLSGEVLPAPEDAADVAVGDAHGHDGHHVRQDEVEYVVSVRQSTDVIER